MEQKFELLYLGAAAIFFVIAIMGWMETERQMNQCLAAVGQKSAEERIVIRSGGD